MVSRRRFGAILLSLSAMTLSDPSHPDSTLSPRRTLAGGLGAAAAGYVKLIYPSAIAMGAGELYVVDSGLGALLAIDLTTERIRSVATIPGLPAVQLQSAPGGGVFVLRPDLGSVQRLDRNGREVSRLTGLDAVSQPRSISLSPDGSEAWVVDTDGRLRAFGGLGRQDHPLSGDDGHVLWRTVKSGGGRAYGIDEDCLCLAEIGFDGQALQRFDTLRLTDPGPMAIDRDGRAWVVDNADGHLHVFFGGRRLGLYAPNTLGVLRITALAAGPAALYVADGPGARVIEMRLTPMERRP